MADISAQNVKALRDSTGAGMMDAKRALVESGGDAVKAAAWLRERGLGKAAERSARENVEGAVAVAITADGLAGAIVELKSETDFGAKSPKFVTLVNDLAVSIARLGEDEGLSRHAEQVDDLKVTIKENIEVGSVSRFEAPQDHRLSSYLHVQNGRGVNAVLVELDGGDGEMAHDVAVHIAFGRPGFLQRDEVPADAVAAERASLEAQTRNEGKPEAALPKIIQGKLNGWFKRVPGGVLVEQPYAKDDKISVATMLGDVSVVRFTQITVGG